MILNIISSFICANKISDFAPISKTMSEFFKFKITSKALKIKEAIIKMSIKNQIKDNPVY